MKKEIIETEIVTLTQLGEFSFQISLLWNRSFYPEPGQFAMLSLSRKLRPFFIRRPIAFSGCSSGFVSIIVEAVGPVTDSLVTLPPGTPLSLIAPLGNSFSLPPKGSRPILAAGGAGVGPLLFWAERLGAEGFSPTLILGAKEAKRVPAVEIPFGELIVVTEDGSIGERGTVIDILKQRLKEGDRLYSCGPQAMMEACALLAKKSDIPCFVSMESYMGCGVGACSGCAIPLAKGGYTKVCSNGPVFDSRELKWS